MESVFYEIETLKLNNMNSDIIKEIQMTTAYPESESDKHAGAGYEILILPSKYKDVNSQYLDMVRMLATVRCGEVIYV